MPTVVRPPWVRALASQRPARNLAGDGDPRRRRRRHLGHLGRYPESGTASPALASAARCRPAASGGMTLLGSAGGRGWSPDRGRHRSDRGRHADAAPGRNADRFLRDGRGLDARRAAAGTLSLSGLRRGQRMAGSPLWRRDDPRRWDSMAEQRCCEPRSDGSCRLRCAGGWRWLSPG